MNTEAIQIGSSTMACVALLLRSPQKLPSTPFRVLLQPCQISANTAYIGHLRTSAALPADNVQGTQWFNERANRWEKETAIHSAPGSKYFHKDYMAVITKGSENPAYFIPMILERIAIRGGDWFFALETIADENPAKDCEDYESALKAWKEWMRVHGMTKEGAAVLSA
jgi:hypothetical protein